MVSVIMGVYNSEHTLQSAIDSLTDQTFANWKLIVCDDCSKDKSLQILKENAKKDSRIIIISNRKNLGLAPSLNLCLKKVNSKYVARMDADDISRKDRLEKQLLFLEKNPGFDLVGSQMLSFDENKIKHIIDIKEIPIKEDLPKFSPFHHATIMVKTSVIKDLKGYRESLLTRRTEDVDLWYRFFKKGFKGYNLQLPLYFVRENNECIKRRKLIYSFHASIIIFKGVIDLKLPKKMLLYSMKPILSYFTPLKLKKSIRSRLFKK